MVSFKQCQYYDKLLNWVFIFYAEVSKTLKKVFFEENLGFSDAPLNCALENIGCLLGEMWKIIKISVKLALYLRTYHIWKAGVFEQIWWFSDKK